MARLRLISHLAQLGQPLDGRSLILQTSGRERAQRTVKVRLSALQGASVLPGILSHAGAALHVGQRRAHRVGDDLLGDHR